ncbi:hypothetical protein [Parabacteroides sp.]
MKYLEAILGFLTTIARIIFRGKGKHKPNRPAIDNTGHSSDEYGSVAGSHRGDTLALPENSPSPENLMGWALIVCAVSGYLVKLLA